VASLRTFADAAASPCGARLAMTQNQAVKVIELDRNML
jgi:hypothetical protein